MTTHDTTRRRFLQTTAALLVSGTLGHDSKRSLLADDPATRQADSPGCSRL